jgi:hypothetical protein
MMTSMPRLAAPGSAWAEIHALTFSVCVPSPVGSSRMWAPICRIDILAW